MRLPLERTIRRAARVVGPLNIAHRGASADAPENTMAAIGLARAQGADLVEVDVQRTRDGVLVLMHDTTLVRTTNAQRVYPTRGPWRVGDFTHEELRRLDAGSWKSEVYEGEPVPTLRELLSWTRWSEMGLQLELKAPHLYPGAVGDLADLLLGVPSACDVVVQSFNFASMKELKTRIPKLRVGLLGAPARGHLSVLGTWASQINPYHRTVDKGYVDAVHDEGMQCCVWTVNGASAMRRALRLGVDGVITNRPARFASARAGRRTHLYA